MINLHAQDERRLLELALDMKPEARSAEKRHALERLATVRTAFETGYWTAALHAIDEAEQAQRELAGLTGVHNEASTHVRFHGHGSQR